MKNLVLILLPLISLSYTLLGQQALEQEALHQAQQMAKLFNENDFNGYVEYHIASQYGEDKAKYVQHWQDLRSYDTSQLKIIKVSKLKSVHKEYQVVLQNSYRQSLGWIIGISKDKGKHWLFSQPFSSGIYFSTIANIFPSFDLSFASIIDPKFGKRIHYEINKTIEDFKFIDITGDSISSAKLQSTIIVFTFWSLSCGPCIKEMPALNELVKKMEGKNVIFVAPAFYSPREQLIRNFLPKHPFLYKIVDIENPDDYEISSFPTHIIIDENHKVVYNQVGASEENLKNIYTLLDKMLKN